MNVNTALCLHTIAIRAIREKILQKFHAGELGGCFDEGEKCKARLSKDSVGQEYRKILRDGAVKLI